MRGRRILYVSALAAAVSFHLAFGQYVSHYILLFVLCLPIVSLLLSLPAILLTKVELVGAEDVQRGNPSHVRVRTACRFFLPLDCLKLCIEEQNLFASDKPTRHVFRLVGLNRRDKTIKTTTDRIGTIRCSIRYARAYDYLGIFALPVHKSNAVTFTVMPTPTAPDPMPVLIDPSEQILKPKPQGFSEEHELRGYRPGDSLNLIHWKLSSKHDDLIIREPQELIRKNIILAIDLPDTYAAQQSLLDQLSFLTDHLLQQQISFTLYIGMKILRIRSDGEVTTFLKTFLSEPLHAEATLPIRTGNDTLVCRLTPVKEVLE